MATPSKLFVTANGEAPDTNGVAVSSTSTYYSKMWSGEMVDGYSLQLSWTGTPTGTLTLWMSNKPNPSEADDADWVQDTTFSPTNPAGSASKMMDNASGAPAYRKRIKYVNASGSGVLYGYVTVPRVR